MSLKNHNGTFFYNDMFKYFWLMHILIRVIFILTLISLQGLE